LEWKREGKREKNLDEREYEIRDDGFGRTTGRHEG
jgi:hypothetical protein